MLNRRGLFVGLLFAPAIIRVPGLLMPIKPVSIDRSEYGYNHDGGYIPADVLADRKRAIRRLFNRDYMAVTRGYGSDIVVGYGRADLHRLIMAEAA